MRTPALLDGDQDGNERQFERAIDAGQLFLLELLLQQRRQLPDEIGALARIVDGRLDRHLGERQRLHALAADVFLRDRLVGGVFERQILEPMRRSCGVQQVTRQASCRCPDRSGRRRAWRRTICVELEVVTGLA